jgi:integrase
MLHGVSVHLLPMCYPQTGTFRGWSLPTIKFKARSIEALKAPKEGRVEHWSAELPGFGLRISKDNRRTWVALYRHQGRLRRFTIGTSPPLSLADAREKAEDILRAAARGKDPAAEKKAERQADTVSELVDLYIERHAKLKKRSWKTDRRMLNRDVVPAWGARKVKDIRRRDVIDWLDKLMDRGAPIMANRTFEVVRKMFAFAEERDIIEVSPFHGVSKRAPENAREKVLTVDEIRAVWRAIQAEPPLLSGILTLRLLTAQRGGEVRAMRWQDIETDIEKVEEGVWWTIPGEFSKNGRAHRVWLSRPAIDVLKGVRRQHKDPVWVFPGKKGPQVVVWSSGSRVRKASNVEFVPHDLRRTAASYMTSIGISRLTVSKLLNHSDPSVTKVYDRYSYDAEKRRALDMWAQLLTDILSGTR